MCDYRFKYVIIGDSGVGKSSIINKFMKDVDKPCVTMGVDFRNKIIEIDNHRIKLFIWDTAGQEIYKSVISHYYKTAMAIILVFDLNNPESFCNCEKWMEEIKKHISDENVLIYLVGNKCDMDMLVSIKNVNDFCLEHKIKFITSSVINGMNIDNIFYKITGDILDLKKKNLIKFNKIIGIFEPENTISFSHFKEKKFKEKKFKHLTHKKCC